MATNAKPVLPTDAHGQNTNTTNSTSKVLAENKLAQAHANVTKQLLKSVGETAEVRPLKNTSVNIPVNAALKTLESTKLVQNTSLPKANIQTFTVVTSSAKQGFQTLQPQAGTGVAPFQIKLPTEAPIGTNITVRAETNGSVKILAVDTSNAKFGTTSLQEAQVLTKTSASPLAPKTHITAESIQKMNIKNSTPLLSDTQVKNIVNTAKVDASTLTKIPAGTTLELTPSTTKKTMNPENVTITQTLATKGGQAVKVETPHQIPSGSTMTIKITAQGKIDILRVDPDNASGNALRRDPESATRNPRLASHLNQGLDDNLKTPLAPLVNRKSVQLSNTVALPIGKPVAGIVSAQGANSTLTLNLPNGGSIGIQSANTLPLGTIVTLEAKADGSISLLQTKIPDAFNKADVVQKFSGKWDALNDAIGQLKTANAEKAEALQRNIPDISKPTFLINMLRFSGMVASQEFAKMVDAETLNLLRAMGVDLSADIQQLNTLQQKPDSAESWRSLFFPYTENDDGDTSQGSFSWRQGKDKTSDEPHIRFIVQISLSKLGPVQIDGLMEKSNLNIKLRLKQQVSEEDKKELKTIINTALENLSLTGDILIEYLERNEVDPTQAHTKSEPTLNVNI